MFGSLLWTLKFVNIQKCVWYSRWSCTSSMQKVVFVPFSVMWHYLPCPILFWPFHTTAHYQFLSSRMSYLPTSLSSLLHLIFDLSVIPSQTHSQAALFSKLSLLWLFCFHGSIFTKFFIIFFVHCFSYSYLWVSSKCCAFSFPDH